MGLFNRFHVDGSLVGFQLFVFINNVAVNLLALDLNRRNVYLNPLPTSIVELLVF